MAIKNFIDWAQHEKPRQLGLSDRIRLDYLLEKASAYELVSKANEEGRAGELAREIIEKMYLEIKVNQIL